MTPMRLFPSVVAVLLAAWLGGCSGSGPAKRNIEVVYRFENLRTPTSVPSNAKTKVAPFGPDEWSEVKTILDRASTKPVTVTRFAVRPLGNVEVANYEAKCVLPSLVEFSRVQADLEALGASDAGHERIETFLSQVSATYKSNFVLAAVNIGVSGASVTGHRIRIYGIPGDPPVETTVGASGVWTVRLAVVPKAKWVYGLSEDPTGRIPTRYFRINVTTRQQERVEEPEFLKMFPPGAAHPAATGAAKAADAKTPRPPSASRDDRAAQDARKREADEIRKRRDEEDKRIRDARSKGGK